MPPKKNKHQKKNSKENQLAHQATTAKTQENLPPHLDINKPKPITELANIKYKQINHANRDIDQRGLKNILAAIMGETLQNLYNANILIGDINPFEFYQKNFLECFSKHMQLNDTARKENLEALIFRANLIENNLARYPTEEKLYFLYELAFIKHELALTKTNSPEEQSTILSTTLDYLIEILQISKNPPKGSLISDNLKKLLVEKSLKSTLALLQIMRRSYPIFKIKKLPENIAGLNTLIAAGIKYFNNTPNLSTENANFLISIAVIKLNKIETSTYKETNLIDLFEIYTHLKYAFIYNQCRVFYVDRRS